MQAGNLLRQIISSSQGLVVREQLCLDCFHVTGILPAAHHQGAVDLSYQADPELALTTHKIQKANRAVRRLQTFGGERLQHEIPSFIPCRHHTTSVRSGRSGRPRETKGITVTVPLLTGREIRALKRPEASSV